MQRTSTGRASNRRRFGAPAALGAALVTAAAGFGLWPAPNAAATTVAYTGTTSGTQSSITIHRGDAYQRVLNPEGTVTATLDDTAKKIAGGQVMLKPSFTATFVGPFNLNLYVRTDLEQVGQVTGTATPSATTPGTTDLVATATTRLHLTVYNQKGTTQSPSTDPTLTDPVKCAVDLTLTLKGSANRRTGALSLKQDPFTIPTFPNGTPDPNKTCGLATNALNTQVAGANNAINLNFSGGPTSAHYTGVTTGTQSTIVIKKGNWLLEKTVHPTGTLVSDIDFTTNTVKNTKATFGSIDVPALPGILAAVPANAHIDMSVIGTPAATIAPSGTPGIDKITVATTARMAVTVSLFNDPGVKLTNPATCFVDIKLNLTGTVDRGTDALSLGQNPFTIPKFPFFGCGLLGTGLDTLVSGSNNTISLNYVDGVVPPTP
jgi:hypothetical protein